jgi:hypothetical protein
MDQGLSVPVNSERWLYIDWKKNKIKYLPVLVKSSFQALNSALTFYNFRWICTTEGTGAPIQPL